MQRRVGVQEDILVQSAGAVAHCTPAFALQESRQRRGVGVADEPRLGGSGSAMQARLSSKARQQPSRQAEP